MFPAKLQQVSCRWCNFIRISGSPLPSCIFCSFFRSLYLSMSFSQPVCFVLLFQQSFSSSLPEVWPSTDLFGSPYRSYSLSFSLSLFILIPPLSRPSSASSSFTRYVSADGIEASHLFNFRDPASFIFIHGTSYTSLISQASEQPRIASYPPPPMRWEGHRDDREPEGEIRKRERKRERERERERKRERVGWVSGTTRWKDLRQGVCVTHRI